MRGLNRVMLIGHLGSKPEKLTSQTGKTYCRLNLATNRSWKDESGERQERTDWHYVVAWGSEAERCVQYLEKGSLIYVEGMISTFENTRKENKPKMTTITADTVQFLKIALPKPPSVEEEAVFAH